MNKTIDITQALKNCKPTQKSDSDETKKLKSIIYHECHSKPNQLCKGSNCPLHDVMEMCEKRHRLGLF